MRVKHFVFCAGVDTTLAVVTVVSWGRDAEQGGSV